MRTCSRSDASTRALQFISYGVSRSLPPTCWLMTGEVGMPSCSGSSASASNSSSNARNTQGRRCPRPQSSAPSGRVPALRLSIRSGQALGVPRSNLVERTRPALVQTRTPERCTRQPAGSGAARWVRLSFAWVPTTRRRRMRLRHRAAVPACGAADRQLRQLTPPIRSLIRRSADPLTARSSPRSHRLRAETRRGRTRAGPAFPG
jgi:hypothetical protein